jgi:hypothetical protein
LATAGWSCSSVSGIFPTSRSGSCIRRLALYNLCFIPLRSQCILFQYTLKPSRVNLTGQPPWKLAVHGVRGDGRLSDCRRASHSTRWKISRDSWSCQPCGMPLKPRRVLVLVSLAPSPRYFDRENTWRFLRPTRDYCSCFCVFKLLPSKE